MSRVPGVLKQGFCGFVTQAIELARCEFRQADNPGLRIDGNDDCWMRLALGSSLLPGFEIGSVAVEMHVSQFSGSKVDDDGQGEYAEQQATSPSCWPVWKYAER